MIAKHGTAHPVELLVGKYRRVERLQGLDDMLTQQREQSMHVFYEPGGTMVLHVRLPAEQGALLLRRGRCRWMPILSRRTKMFPRKHRRRKR